MACIEPELAQLLACSRLVQLVFILSSLTPPAANAPYAPNNATLNRAISFTEAK